MSENFYSPESELRRRDVPVSPQTIAENIQKLTHGLSVSIDQLREESPITIPDEPAQQTAIFLSRAFGPEDFINIVSEFKMAKMDGREKGVPRGAGLTRSVSNWLETIGKGDLPGSDAGAWVRVNAVGTGTGSGGTITDADVANFRHLLIECDYAPLDLQCSLLAHLALPIVAITESGDRSLHALIRVNASDANTYASSAKAIFQRLRVLGFDTTNSNPSRLTRLPGITRTADVASPTLQRLLYLNPSPSRNPILHS